MTELDFRRFTHVTFDCYGTLIDWETGILGALQPVLERRRLAVDPGDLLALYARHEAEVESGPYRTYDAVLREVMSRVCRSLGFSADPPDVPALAQSVGTWRPFPDTTSALQRLAARFVLAIISNVDDVMFTKTQAQLGVRFGQVVTAEQVGSYKPSLRNFEVALARLGVEPNRVLHVAQSLYHDHVPAKTLGLTTVWVNRPSHRPATGVAPDAVAQPDLTVTDLAALADLMDA